MVMLEKHIFFKKTRKHDTVDRMWFVAFVACEVIIMKQEEKDKKLHPIKYKIYHTCTCCICYTDELEKKIGQENRTILLVVKRDTNSDEMLFRHFPLLGLPPIPVNSDDGRATALRFPG